MSLRHSQTEWKYAPTPNYETNLDLRYPYSEVPYIGQYKLVRLPSADVIPLVDYWGEGYITTEHGTSGFRNCYNINHEYQLVSNGADRNRKIPNRVPVISYTNCDTSAYIKDASVKIVTLMGAPINQSCARDIARIVHRQGIVIVYGFDENSADVKNLDNALAASGLTHCRGVALHCELRATLYDDFRMYLSDEGAQKELYNAIVNDSYDQAAYMSRSMENTKENVIKVVLTRLLDNKPENIMTYAYKLGLSGGGNILNSCFPKEITNIFEDKWLIIKNIKFNMNLKLDMKTDGDGDRQAWGDASDSADSLRWKFIPYFNDNKVLFKIQNQEYSRFLKPSWNEDDDGNRGVYGDEKSTHERFYWDLLPKSTNGIVFQIKNVKYQQHLKLGDAVAIGDRSVQCHAADDQRSDLFHWLVTI